MSSSRAHNDELVTLNAYEKTKEKYIYNSICIAINIYRKHVKTFYLLDFYAD